MTSFTYRLCLLLINSGRTQGIMDKIDVFFVKNRLSKEEYNALSDALSSKEV